MESPTNSKFNKYKRQRTGEVLDKQAWKSAKTSLVVFRASGIRRGQVSERRRGRLSKKEYSACFSSFSIKEKHC
jgi:hypothetical protein